MSSPIYREERLEYSLKWAETENNPAVEAIPLAFKNSEFLGNMESPSIICKGYEDADDKNSHSINLYLSPTYDNKESVYVAKEKDGGPFLSRYFTKVPILIHFPENIQRIHLSRNYYAGKVTLGQKP